jgi:hypothetical protein
MSEAVASPSRSNVRGPSVVCVRSDHDADLNVPADMLAGFVEVYNGPADAEPQAAEALRSATT